MAKKKVIETSLSVKGGSLTKAHTMNLKLVFLENDPIYDWATSERKIAFQRVLRTKTDEMVEKLPNPFELLAQDAGKNIRTREERIAEFVSMGIPQKMAQTLVDSPEKLAEFEKMLS